MKLTLENTERGIEIHENGSFVAEVATENEGVEIVSKVNKLNDIQVIETHYKDFSEWGISFDGCNPTDDYFFSMPKDTAIRLKNYLSTNL